ncbi:MAG: N-acetyltransferase [Alcaligenaceae bacterium]|nr:N-acetyltransferase [Alcaligenaceae bacterium]
MSQKLQISILDSPSDLKADTWQSFCQKNPFTGPDFLQTLHASTCVAPEYGWHARYLYLQDEHQTPLGLMPLYVKTHSRGEFVFDMAWANAFERHGLAYYPKLVCSIPFTPVTGPRLLSNNQQHKRILAEQAIEVAKKMGVSSLHVLFPNHEDLNILRECGYMIREDVQFHWENRGYESFEDFLKQLNYDKRKKIRQDRKKVLAAGVSFRHLRGSDISPETLDFFISCYQNTYYERGRAPYLNREFFHSYLQKCPDNILLILAIKNGQSVACALNIIGDETVYGRYWGAHEFIPGLHFETCYMQSIEFCIEHEFRYFEGGAQGEHKLARGLLPVTTYSAHWIARQDFAAAIEAFLDVESRQVGKYVDMLATHSPFRQTG